MPFKTKLEENKTMPGNVFKTDLFSLSMCVLWWWWDGYQPLYSPPQDADATALKNKKESWKMDHPYTFYSILRSFSRKSRYYPRKKTSHFSCGLLIIFLLKGVLSGGAYCSTSSSLDSSSHLFAPSFFVGVLLPRNFLLYFAAV